MLITAAILSFGLFLIGCTELSGDVTASFKENFPESSYLGTDIDFDDYIVKVKNADHLVTVKYVNVMSGNEVSESFYGYNMVFYPKTKGTHTVVYTVTRGGKTASATKEIEIIADPPIITISHTAQTLSMPESGKITRSLDLLMSNASMTLTPMTATTKVVKVEYRGITVGLDSKGTEWEELELESDAETFEFAAIGEYRFYVRAESEGNYSEDYFFVDVIKDPSAGTETTDGTPVVKYGKGVVYSESDPYTFKIMSSSIADLNYAVLDKKISDGEKLSFVFKGKNAPQLGLYVQPNEDGADPYNVKTTQGCFFSFVAKESSGHKWVFYFPNMLTGGASKTPVPGVNDFGIKDFDENSYYLMQYSLTDTKEPTVKIDSNGVLRGWRYKINVEVYEVESYSADGINSSCTINDKLYEIGAEGEVYYKVKDEDNPDEWKKFDFGKGYPVIYGDIRNNIDIQYILDPDKITLAPKKEVQNDKQQNLYSYKAVVTPNADGTVTAGLNSGKILDDLETGISDQLGYVGVTDSGFGIGATIQIDFEGKNLPGIGIYLGNSPEGYVVGGATASGTGFYIGNGNVNGETGSIQRRLIVNGPNRLDPGGTYRGNSGYPPYYDRIDGLSYLGETTNTAEMGYNLLEDGKKYRFCVTDVSKEAGEDLKKFSLKYELYDMSGDSPELICSVTKTVDRNYDTINFKSQTIAFFGSIHQDLKFTFKVTGERTEYPYSSYYDPDAITLKGATVTETKDESGNILFSGTYDFVGLGEYKVGDTLEFKFFGRNIPNVGLFVDKDGVNPLGGGTENTGIFIQTSGHGAATYNKRLYITGPYLLDAGSVDAYSGIEGFSYRNWLGANKELGVDVSYEVDGGRFSKFGIDMLDINTLYIYRVTTEAGSADGKVKIICRLYSVIESEDGSTSATETLVSEFSKEITHYLDSLENRYAVVYGAGSFSKKDIRVAINVVKS